MARGGGELEQGVSFLCPPMTSSLLVSHLFWAPLSPCPPTGHMKKQCLKQTLQNKIWIRTDFYSNLRLSVLGVEKM